MKFFCLDVPRSGATMEQYQPHMISEVRHAWQLYKDGFIREIYFRQDRPGVVIVAEGDSVEEVKAALNEFPLAKAGLIDFDMIPVGPFTHWEALFAPAKA